MYFAGSRCKIIVYRCIKVFMLTFADQSFYNVNCEALISVYQLILLKLFSNILHLYILIDVGDFTLGFIYYVAEDINCY